MSMIRIKIPATSANLGPGLFSTALALRLHNTVDVSERETGFKINISGDEFVSSQEDITGLILAVLENYFRHIHRAPSGLDIAVDQVIPADAGLGSERAIEMAALLGVNLLMGSPLNREELVQLIAKPRRDASAVVAAVRGGLISTAVAEDHLIHESLPIGIDRIGIVRPQNLSNKLDFPDDGRITIKDARTQARGLAMCLLALGTGDLQLLADAFHRIKYDSNILPALSGYDQALSIWREYEGTAVTISGWGPSLLVFSGDQLEEVVDRVRTALRRGTQSEVASWIVPVDTQGVAISEMGGFVTERIPPIPVDEQRLQSDA